MHFYDSAGKAQLYTDDGEHLFTWSGKPVAYFYGDHIYSMSGQHLGWRANGWLIDSKGRRMLFEPNATGGPLKPARSLDSVKSIKSAMPIKGARSIAPVKPIFSSAWSQTRFW